MYCVIWLQLCVLLARSLYAEHPSAIQLLGGPLAIPDKRRPSSTLHPLRVQWSIAGLRAGG
jgi:hypothetical protein